MKDKNKIKQELAKSYFGEETKNYDYKRSKNKKARYVLERKIKIIKKFLKKTKGKNILDVACGTGRFFPLYRNLKIYGVDISKDQLAEAKKKDKKAILQIADAEKLPFHSNKFDIVITSQFLEHIPQYKNVIREMIRVCKPQGILIMDFPNKHSLTYLPTKIRVFFKRLRWLNLFSKKEIQKIAKNNNLEILDYDNTVIITPHKFPDFSMPLIKKIDKFLYKFFKQFGYLHYVKFRKNN